MPLVTENVLGSICNTPLVELRKVVPAGCGRVFAKLEWGNPTGSMKDRMAAAAIRSAEADGRLQPGGTVVEYTAGTTGISPALVRGARRRSTKSAVATREAREMTRRPAHEEGIFGGTSSAADVAAAIRVAQHGSGCQRGHRHLRLGAALPQYRRLSCAVVTRTSAPA